MKKTQIYFILATIAIAMSSCKLIDKLTSFNVDYSTTYTIPATLIPITILSANTPDITTNSEETFTNNNTKSDHIQEVLLKKLTLTITSPSGQKFDFLKSAAVYISADGLPEVQVATIDNIDGSTVGNSIEMNPSGQDLQEYVKKSKITLRVSSTTDKVVSNDVTVRVDAKFWVNAKLIA